jgi:hypothetical protein
VQSPSFAELVQTRLIIHFALATTTTTTITTMAADSEHGHWTNKSISNIFSKLLFVS